MHWSNVWIAVVPGIVGLGFIIFAHELGHFLVAKWRGVKVLRFSLGFGPAMLSRTVGDTEYRLAWFPLGGYVQMAGDSPADDGSMPGGPEQFLSHPWPGRLMIAIAGPLGNLIGAYVLLVVVASVVGVSRPDAPSRLGPVADTSAAYHAGFREGDMVVAVDGTSVHSWNRMEEVLSRQPEKRPLTLRLQRAGGSVRITLSPELRRPVFQGLQPPELPPVVGAVATGMPAYKAGLKEGDRILAIGGKPVRVWGDLSANLRGQVDRQVVLRVRRGTQIFDIPVTPMNPTGGRAGNNGIIGVEPPYPGIQVERYGLLESLRVGVPATAGVIAQVYSGMWLTVTRFLYYREYLGGPLFIVQVAGEQAKRGMDFYLQFVAMISIAIMAFNLLPIPILDGGHIVLALLQAVRGQAISARGYIRFQKVGLVVIGALFLLILANDPLRMLQRQRALQKAPQEQEKTVAPSPP